MLNKAILMGRLAADPEMRQTPNGVDVATFRIAVNRTYNRELTDWIDIVAWRQTAKFVHEYFHKGQMIVVEGSIQTRNYEDKQGNKHKAVEVVAEQVHFGEKSRGDTPPPVSDQDDPQPFKQSDFEDYEELDDENQPF